MVPDHIADDLRQETLARVITELHQEGGIRHPERFGALVMSICNSVLWDYHRSSHKNQPIEVAPKDIPDDDLGPEATSVTKPSGEQVNRILEGMPKRDRDLLRAIFLEEKEKDAICKEMGVDRDYLRVLVRRTKLAFHQAYNAQQLPSGEQGEPHIATAPPGTTLHSIAELMCCKKTMDEIVRPLLADMQFEYEEALAAGRKSKATWIRVRGCWSFSTALGLNRLIGVFARIFLRFSSR
jgi:RNA polymerase sigma-70 factor (ECF subfamily)